LAKRSCRSAFTAAAAAAAVLRRCCGGGDIIATAAVAAFPHKSANFLEHMSQLVESR